MSPALKLLTGLAASALVARAGHIYFSQALLADLGGRAGAVMAAHGITDGAVRWTDARGYTFRMALLSGTAAPATRSAVVAQVRRLDGIAGARWEAR
ncbi:hypothetical protein [Sandarakinorhabdus sp.]|uniref:hypothetical protein n=1 Tax=Sandarakinorhabdus sp. TaxID=1916663 RepID=UPI00286D9641|nr:hypothetical protein [Sandarakinorhabdus sp.]